MIVDGHLDIAWNAVADGRRFDVRTPGYVVSRPALEAAGVGLVFATLYAAPASTRRVGASFTYDTPREAALMGRAQLGWYRSAGPPLIRDRGELEAHVRGWHPGRLAAVLLMEGADPVEKPVDVAWWAGQGVRIVGPAWSRTRYAGGTGAPGGLTEDGVKLLRAMRRASLVLDLSHLAERAVADALALWKGPLIASHSNARALVPGDRQLPDATVAEVARRGGVVGVSFFRRHLRADEGAATLADVARHIVHHARAAGGPEHVALGTDLDGGFDAAEAPFRRLERISALRARLRVFSSAQVEGIMGGNWIEFLRRSLPARVEEDKA